MKMIEPSDTIRDYTDTTARWRCAPMRQRMTRCRPTSLLLLLVGIFVLVGCKNLPGQPDIIDVKGQYLDLENRSVAVVVSTSDYTEFNHPDARGNITREITRRIVSEIPEVTATNPDEILKWQDDNPYWNTRPPSAIIEQLGVDRLIMVEIGEYRTHEPGDKYVLRGVISASVNIVEAEAADPDNYGAAFSKTVLYPRSQDSKIGQAAVSEEKIEMQTQLRFCEETAGLFYDHQIIR